MANYTDKIYRLVDILDREDNSRAETDIRHREFYRNLMGCIARNIRENTSFRSVNTPGAVEHADRTRCAR